MELTCRFPRSDVITEVGWCGCCTDLVCYIVCYYIVVCTDSSKHDCSALNKQSLLLFSSKTNNIQKQKNTFCGTDKNYTTICIMHRTHKVYKLQFGTWMAPW